MDLISTINAITLYLGLSTAPIAVQFAAIIALSIVSLIVIGAIGFGLYKLCSTFKKSPQEEEIPLLEEAQLPPVYEGEIPASLAWRAAVEALPLQQRACYIVSQRPDINRAKFLQKNNLNETEYFDMVKDAMQKVKQGV